MSEVKYKLLKKWEKLTNIWAGQTDLKFHVWINRVFWGFSSFKVDINSQNSKGFGLAQKLGSK